MWDPKVYSHSFKEEFGSDFFCDTFLASSQNRHLKESINDHENTSISMLGRRKTQDVIHGDGFPGSVRSR